jgi:hypothetical protein
VVPVRAEPIGVEPSRDDTAPGVVPGWPAAFDAADAPAGDAACARSGAPQTLQ